jgi:HEAT repeat protein
MKRRKIFWLASAILLVLALSGGWIVIQILRHPAYEGQTIAQWAFQMTASDQASRNKATEVIRRVGPSAIPELAQAVVAKDSRFRTAAWRSIPKVPLVVRRLIARTVKPPDAVLLRMGAARGLALFGPEAQTALPELEIAFHDKYDPVVTEAGIALTAIGAPALPVFQRGLTNSDARIRRTSAYLLRDAGTGAIASTGDLFKALEDSDDSVRANAAYTIARVQTHVISNLAVVAQSGSVNSRDAAARGLMLLQQTIQRSMPSLVRMAKDADPNLRREAVEILRSLLTQSPPLGAFMGALEDPVVDVRLAAVNALGSLGGRARPAAQALIRLLADDSPQVRAAAARALATLGAPSPEVVPPLQKLLGDRDPAVQAAAREALGRLGVASDK